MDLNLYNSHDIGVGCGSQADPIEYETSETQTGVATNVETQTPQLGTSLKKSSSSGRRSSSSSSSSSSKEAASTKDGSEAAEEADDAEVAMRGAPFAVFLRDASALMQQQLELNARSRAFDGVELSSGSGSLGGAAPAAAVCLHELCVPPSEPSVAAAASGSSRSRSRSRAAPRCIPCTGVDWNSTGSVLAASLGRNDHVGWCCANEEQHGAPVGLALWNVFGHRSSANANASAAGGSGASSERDQWSWGGDAGADVAALDAAERPPAAAPGHDEALRAPDTFIPTSSCLMCVACHPTSPGMVAGGTYTGEVILWDTGKADDEACVGTSPVGDYYHRDPVVKVCVCVCVCVCARAGGGLCRLCADHEPRDSFPVSSASLPSHRLLLAPLFACFPLPLLPPAARVGIRRARARARLTQRKRLRTRPHMVSAQ